MTRPRRDRRAGASARWAARARRGAAAAVLLAGLAAARAGAATPPPNGAPARAVDHWGEEQGVPGPVTALLQSADGFLWVGTRRGLVRFDGISFSQVPLRDGTAELNVRALAEDGGGGVWIASDGGLARLAGAATGRVECRDLVVQTLAWGRDGTLWAGTDRGLAAVRGERLEPVAGEPGAVVAVTEDATGRLLVGGGGGLRVLRGGRLEPLPEDEGGTSRAVRALLTDRAGRTWVGTAEGLLRADAGGRAPARTFGAGLVTSSVSALAEDREGRIWVATVAGGLQRLSPDGGQAGTREAGLSPRPVAALALDRDGQAWIGSSAGLDRLRERLLVPIGRREGLSAEVAWSVSADPRDGALWVGLDGTGLDRLAGGRAVGFGPRWGLGAATVAATLRTRDGALWISARADGVVRVVGDRPGPVLDAAGAPYVRVRGLAQASDGGVWLGTETGLERHAGGRAQRVPVARGWPFRVVVEDGRGGLWAGGAGLARVDGATRAETTPPAAAGVRNVMSLLPDGDDLWIASYSEGLQVWHGGQVTSLGALDRRFGGRAVAVLADGRGGLWTALEGSLVLARRAELLEAAEGRRHSLRVQVFDERDGMASTEFTAGGQSPAARTPDGRLWFTTVGGLVVADPERLARLGPPAPPQVERAFVAGVEAPRGAPALRLAHRQDTLELRFTSPTLVSPHQLRFRHRLLGLDPAWLDSGPQRTVVYRGLGEGDYRFELQASRDGGEWVPMAAPLGVVVRVGPLERGWVQALLAALAAAALAAALAAAARLRTVHLRAQAEELGRLVEARTRELAAARDELESRVEERTAQLQRELAERERLERQLLDAQKLDSIGRLAGGVAHDLNNLLTVVLGCASTARLPEATAEEIRADLGEIQQAGERAAALTRQLLAFARRQILAARRLDLNEVVTGVGALLRRVIGAPIELVTDVAAGPCPVVADPGQLEQVLVNLAVNARDAMPGGGTLRLETALVRLDDLPADAHPGVAAGDWVRLRVSDTGTGLTEEAKRHLFEPFFTTKAKGKGTGLGLATCYGIVKQTGGHIWLRSEPGRGTEVTILLPRAEGRPEAPPAEAPLAAAGGGGGGGERVLLVEDEPQVRALAARALTERGYRVTTAGDGEEALRLLEAAPAPFDLLLTDVVMPRLGGVELAARVRARHPRQAVLFMSGYVDRSAVGQGALPEDARIILKPFTPAALAAQVRGVLDARPGP